MEKIKVTKVMSDNMNDNEIMTVVITHGKKACRPLSHRN